MTTPTNTILSREELLAAGFVPTRYEGQEGEFLTKHTKVGDMPYAGQHLVDDEYIDATNVGVTELTPEGEVQFHIPDADYLEGPIDQATEEAQALLRDAAATPSIKEAASQAERSAPRA